MNREVIRRLEDSGMGMWWFALNVYTDWWNHWPPETGTLETGTLETATFETGQEFLENEFERLDPTTPEEPCVKT